MSQAHSESAELLARKARVVLRTLQASSETIQATALVSNDGLTLASVLGEGVDADRFGAMCASLLALASRAASEIQRGTLRQIILDGTLGPMLLTRAGDTGVLAVATSPTANLGKVILDTRAAAKALAEFTGSSPL